jgi:hypothetical protein
MRLSIDSRALLHLFLSKTSSAKSSCDSVQLYHPPTRNALWRDATT